MNKFSKSEAIKFGWKLTNSNLSFFAVVLAIVLLINLISFLVSKLSEQSQLTNSLVGVFFWIIETIVSMGLIKIALEFVKNQKPKISDLYTYYSEVRLFVNYIIGSFLSGIIIFIGFLLLVVPGIILAIKLQFVSYLIIDKNLGPIEAIKKSWEITENQVWNLFLFGLLLGLINLAGVLALIIGLFWTIPTTSLATAFVYKKLAS